MDAEYLRFRDVPRTAIRFSGTPDYEPSTVSRRRNLPDPVSEHVDYHNVQVDYQLTNRLLDANPADKRQQTAGPEPSPPP